MSPAAERTDPPAGSIRIKLATSIYTALVLIVTLAPVRDQPSVVGLCLLCGERGLADAILNVVLFLPLGIGLRRWAGTAPRAILLALVLSLGIESAQLVIPGRDASPADVLFNGLGAAVGAVLVGRVGRGLAEARSGATRVIVPGVAIALFQFAGGWLLGPDLPPGRYFAFWIPELDQFAPTDARLSSATLDGVSIPQGWVDDVEHVRDLLSRDAPLRLVTRAGTSTDGLAGFFAIYNDRQREALVVGRDRDDLVLRESRRAGKIRLDRPDARIGRFFTGDVAGAELILTVRGEGEARCVDWSVNDPGGPGTGEPHRSPGGTTCKVGVTIGRTWSTLLYQPLVRLLGVDGLLAVDAAWTAGLFALLGLTWAHPAGWIAVTLPLVALATAPAVGGLLPSPSWLYASALAGLLVGIGLRSLVRRRSPGE